jgi:hypothetical protein
MFFLRESYRYQQSSPFYLFFVNEEGAPTSDGALRFSQVSFFLWLPRLGKNMVAALR